jgi:hypothetical protein
VVFGIRQLAGSRPKTFSSGPRPPRGLHPHERDVVRAEFTAPDRKKGWATVIRLAGAPTDAYLLELKGLDEQATYRITLDNTGKTEDVPGARLMQEGILIRPPANPRSELILLERIALPGVPEKKR